MSPVRLVIILFCLVIVSILIILFSLRKSNSCSMKSGLRSQGLNQKILHHMPFLLIFLPENAGTVLVHEHEEQSKRSNSSFARVKSLLEIADSSKISLSAPILLFNSSTWKDEAHPSYRHSYSEPNEESGGERILSRHKRDIPCKRGKRLNSYVSNLFRFAETSILPNNLPMPLENVTIDLPEYNLLLFLYSGELTQVEGIRRKGKAWVYCMNETNGMIVSVGMPTKLEEVRIFYKYRLIKDWKLVYDGNMELQVIHPKAQIQITEFRSNDFEVENQQRVDAVRVWSVGMVRVMLRGLGNLTSALSMILTSWLNNNFDYLFPMVKDRVEETLRVRMDRAIQQMKIPFDFIDP